MWRTKNNTRSTYPTGSQDVSGTCPDVPMRPSCLLNLYPEGVASVDDLSQLFLKAQLGKKLHSLSWRSDTQPYSFLKPYYYISIDHIYPSFPVWCICVLPLICVVFKQLSFMAMRKMWIVVCPSKLTKIHWEKDTGKNDASNKPLKWSLEF